MTHFFLSILIIICGTCLALVLSRWAVPSRTVAVLSIAAGCLSGAFDATIHLFKSIPGSASHVYMDTFQLAFQMDGVSAFFLAVIFLVSALAAIYSFHYMDDGSRKAETAMNYLFFGLLVSSMACVVTAANMITFMLSWELMSLSSYFLVIYDHHSKENQKAGFLYFVFSHVGAMLILSAFGICYGQTGSFDFTALAAMPDVVKLFVFILAFIGFGSKAGIFPFHVWLPHAHPAAPSHISAVMSGVMIKTGIYGIVRMYALLNYHGLSLGVLVLAAGAVSGILGVVYALGQHDLKRLLAYHSVENIGIILIGIGIGMIGVALGHPVMAVFGFAGGLLHVLNHAVFKSLLFMGAGMVLHKTGTRTIDALGGLLKRMKFTGTTFLIGSLAISGLPPFNGFVSEFFIYMGGFKGVAISPTGVALAGLSIISLAVIGGLALACFTKVFGVVFQGEPRTAAAQGVGEKGWTMMLPMGVMALLCVVIGVFPRIFIAMALKAVSALSLGYGRIPMEPFIRMTNHITLAAVVLLAVSLGVWVIQQLLYKGKSLTTSETWGCGFTRPTPRMQYTGTSYAGSILEFFKPAAPLTVDHRPIVGRFPEKSSYHSHINDVAELNMDRIIVQPIRVLFEKLRWIQHGDIHLYIGYILLTLILLLFFI